MPKSHGRGYKLYKHEIDELYTTLHCDAGRPLRNHLVWLRRICRRGRAWYKKYGMTPYLFAHFVDNYGWEALEDPNTMTKEFIAILSWLKRRADKRVYYLNGIPLPTLEEAMFSPHILDWNGKISYTMHFIQKLPYGGKRPRLRDYWCNKCHSWKSNQIEKDEDDSYRCNCYWVTQFDIEPDRSRRKFYIDENNDNCLNIYSELWRSKQSSNHNKEPNVHANNY